MGTKSKYFKLPIIDEEQETIIKALHQRELYAENLLYRVFTINKSDDRAARIEEIVRRGTDRTSDEKGKRYNLTAEHQKELRRLLKPSEYLYAAQESEIKEQLDSIEERTGNLFVSIYDSTKMLQCGNNSYCFKFKHKEKPRDALIALIELEYKPVREGW